MKIKIFEWEWMDSRFGWQNGGRFDAQSERHAKEIARAQTRSAKIRVRRVEAA